MIHFYWGICPPVVIHSEGGIASIKCTLDLNLCRLLDEQVANVVG